MLQAERWRLAIMGLCFLAALILWEARIAFGDVVAVSMAWPIRIVLLASVAFMTLGVADVSRRVKRGGGMPWPRLLAGAVHDLGVPFLLLLIAHYYSPRGPYIALAAPPMLLLPIVVTLSVLRLRPVFALATGLAAGLLHASLAVSAIVQGEVPTSAYPLVLSYGVLLALGGLAAALLTRLVREYIAEAIADAAAAERSSRALQEVEQELDIARNIQLGLLPSEAPHLESYDIAGMSRPAQQAGGDYYDWQALPGGRLIVAVADVTGHGVGPALVMAVCRAYARATAPAAADASDLLVRLNRLIVEDVKGARFITMAIALVDPSGDVDLLSAGHGPTFLHRCATGALERFDGDGLPLGIHDGETYDPIRRLHLDPGDTLLLLTDGFMERIDADGNLFGMRRLSDAIAANAGRPSAELIDQIDRAATAFARGAPQNDDMTAVVIRQR